MPPHSASDNDLTLTQFVKNLVAVPRGLIIATNILDGFDDSLYDANFIKEIFSWWLERYFELMKSRNQSAQLQTSDPQELLMTSLDLLLFEPPPPTRNSTRRKPDFRLSAKPLSGSSRVSEEGLHIIPVHALLFHLITPDERQRIAGRAGIRINRLPPDAKEIAAFQMNKEHTITLRKDRGLGRPGCVLWVTPADDAASDISNRDGADRLRDLLGLVHVEKGDALVAVQLPSHVLGSAVRPTFADAGSHRRFKAKVELVENRERRPEWGYTADLAELALKASLMDGRPERVANPVPGTGIGPIRAMPLGYVREDRGKDGQADDDNAYANLLANRHGGPSRVLGRLERLLGN